MQGDFSSAEKLLKEWMAASPRSPHAWLIFGSVNAGRDRRNDAENCFRKAIEYDPSLSAAWSNLGNILPPAEGIPMILKAIELDPDSYAQYAMLAKHYSTYISGIQFDVPNLCRLSGSE